jgi:hypothetical protein
MGSQVMYTSVGFVPAQFLVLLYPTRIGSGAVHVGDDWADERETNLSAVRMVAAIGCSEEAREQRKK